ncbi:MAG: family 2A encapsulin nanocompartment cargo protein cysteine desulfurase [Methyloprofundus sp.]|nr:family 2A encapsulin nanocompartment cargo protein cysteine desulfurase [Methyloprofundus sp.]
MTTNNSTHIDPSALGLPDECQLTQWANTLFAASPVAQADFGAATDNPVQPILAGEQAIIGQPSGLPLEADLKAQLSDYLQRSAKAPPSSSEKQASDLEIPGSAAIHDSMPPMLATEQSLIGGHLLQPDGLPLQAELKALLAQQLKAPANTLATPQSVDGYYFLNEVSQLGRVAQDAGLGSARPPFDVHAFRRDFPILRELVNGRPLVWFDNAATTQKPQVVIDRLSEFYRHENSNIHRAAHELAARATDAYENSREVVRRFLNASSPNEIVFVRGSTEAINLVAQSYGRQNIGAGDEIVISWLEHHANIVPWQQLCAETGAVLRVIPVDDSGQVILSEYQKLLNAKTKLVSFTHVSNALGTITPAEEMIALAQQVGAKVLLDAAQSVSHLGVDVQQLNCDWLVFSGHKIFGPTGIGVLYGKEELLNSMEPWQGGGNMIEDVTFEKIVYQPAPGRFEAGTGNIADAVGLGAALEYLENIGIENVARYEHELLEYATEQLKCIQGLRPIGTAQNKTSVLSFVLKGHSTADVGKALSENGIAVRSGHHCAQPILRRFGLESTVRPSLAFYNTFAEVDLLAATLRQLQSGKTFFG